MRGFFSPGFAIYEGIVASKRRGAVCYEITLNDNGVAWLAGWLASDYLEKQHQAAETAEHLLKCAHTLVL